jgi:O-antigen ligase/polysaccharide polymerase Wzy-like membrane protein
VARLAAPSLSRQASLIDRVRALQVPPAAALGLAVPALFLHARYQPTASVSLGSTSVDVTLADLAVAAVVLAASLRVRRAGLGPVAPGLAALAAAAGFAALVLVAVSYPLLRDQPYDWQSHLVSALKWGWYLLLAPAAALLVERRQHGVLFLRAFICWSVVATSWGGLQFLGLVDEFEGKRPGQREPSFVGIHDFAAFSGAALAVGLVGLALGDGRPAGRGWTRLALATGGLGIVLSGAMTGVTGLWLAAAALLLLARRHRMLARRGAPAVVALLVAVTAGTALMRGEAITRFAEFVGLRDRVEDTGVQSYAHRTLLAYIGLQIFGDHPIAGSGWQASNEEFTYGPHLDEARRRFPDEPAEAFPSPEHPWGVQNVYIETLADLGLIGLGVLVAVGALAVRTALRGVAQTPLALVGLAWLLVAAGVWLGVGLVPGIPLAALTWLALGLVTTRA